MKSLSAREIKKVLLGVLVTDGHLDVRNQRFEFYSKSKDYTDYLTEVLQQITGMEVRYKYDRKNNGHRIWTTKHVYWKYLSDKLYTNRKVLSRYVISRLDIQSIAHMWMCDGYLEHNKNRGKNKVQNIGWFCLEAFPKEELELFQQRLLAIGISSSLVKKPWGFGYRVKISGMSLQILISNIYPYILDDFLYKTQLFYKSEKYVDENLSSAGHFIYYYDEVEDIVRHSLKKEKT